METAVKKEVTGYNEVFEEKDYSQRSQSAQRVTDSFYNLITKFYERGWGDCFHFAPRFTGEGFRESIVRHEHYLALKLGIRPEDKVLDVGCGVMGPARNIARFTGAKITGLNINHYQIERCNTLNAQSGVGHLLEAVQGDFMNIPFPDDAFDKIYAIEALCHAPDTVGVYKQILSKLKPGGKALFYEWALTDKYDPSNPDHVKYKEMIEYGNSICELKTTAEIDRAIDEAGFVKEATQDLVQTEVGNNVPWYSTLQAGWSLAQIRHAKASRMVTRQILRASETLGLVKKGVVKTQKILLVAADGLVAAGEAGIFTPMYMVLGSKKK